MFIFLLKPDKPLEHPKSFLNLSDYPQSVHEINEYPHPHEVETSCTVCYYVERSGSRVELRTLDYENPGSNPGCGVKTLGKFFHSTLLQFTQLFK